MNIRAQFLFAAVGLLCFSQPAFAQSASLPANIDPCAAMPMANAQDFAPMIAGMLVPGSNMAEMLKKMQPADMAKMITLQKNMAERGRKDWPNLCQYQGENTAVLASNIRPDVIFLGDSITEFWKIAEPENFSAKVLDRGISGQTTPQILLRFYQDVVALRPRVVHIMAGTNDISGNTGPTANETIVQNIRAMIDLAKANHIRVVLAAIMPCNITANKRDLRRGTRIAMVNVALRELAKSQRISFVDYGTILADSDGGIKTTYANDGLHPNSDGYAAIRPLVDRVIAQNLK